MADVNTTDSTPTTETQTPAGVSPSSTTENQSTPPSEGEGGTLLTGGDNARSASDGDTAVGDDGNSGDSAAAPDDTDAVDERASFYGAPEGDAGYELQGLPEGVEVDKEALDAVTPVAKELNLSSEGLSKIAGIYAEKVLPGVVERVNSQLHQDIAATHAEWATQAKQLVQEDPTFGGNPLPEVQGVAAKALDRFGGPEFRKFLDESGLGNHPAMLKFAYQAGSAISEDSFERGGSPVTPKSSVEKFYGTT